jgi:adenylate kinase family enzyme
MDVLSEATTADKFQLQDNGMYWCHVKGRVVEMSAENYHFISLGYPQRMMQSPRPSEAQREKQTAGDVGGKELSPTNAVVNGEYSLP